MYICVGSGFMVFHETPKITFPGSQSEVTLTNEQQGQTLSLLVPRSESLNPGPLTGGDYTEPGPQKCLPNGEKE